jgi:hypothetical protein
MTATTDTQKPTHEEQVAATFTADVAKHVMTTYHDEGLYRHLLFKEPGRSACWFEIITWPGALTISGDMGTYTFRREPDMTGWFLGTRAASGINPGYWSQKLENAGDVREYHEDVLTQLVEEWYQEVAEDLGEVEAGALHSALDTWVLSEAEDERAVRTALDNFRFASEHEGRLSIEDAWEWDLTRFTWHFLWCCHAIRWGLTTYRAATTKTTEV